jgi:arsenical pump membrane protein
VEAIAVGVLSPADAGHAVEPLRAPIAILLLGVNLGPTVRVSGSLACLLWLESSVRSGLGVSAPDYARVGLVAGVPAVFAAVGLLALSS